MALIRECKKKKRGSCEKYCSFTLTGCSRFVRRSRETRSGAETKSELLTPALKSSFFCLQNAESQRAAVTAATYPYQIEGLFRELPDIILLAFLVHEVSREGKVKCINNYRNILLPRRGKKKNQYHIIT